MALPVWEQTGPSCPVAVDSLDESGMTCREYHGY